MKKLYILLLSLVVFLATNTQSKAEDGKIFPYDIHSKTLENGLNVYVVPMESVGLASYWTIVRTGSRDEIEDGRTGFAHFFEHMMFRGTKKYPQQVYDSIITSIGADANAYTTDDYTAYHLNIAAEDVETVMDLESERFQNLFYMEPEFKTEAGAVYGEYRKNITNPFRVLFEELGALAFEKHTYGHSTIGYVEDVIDMPNQYDYSKRFYSEFYRPENCVIVIAGDVDPEDMFKKVDSYYSAWEQGYKKPEIPMEPEQTSERRKNMKFNGKTNPILAMSYKGIPYSPDSKAYHAASLLGELAFGSNSDLNKKLYLEERKVMFIGADIGMNRDMGLWTVYTQLKDETDFQYVEDEVYKTFEKFSNELVDEETLNNLKNRNKYSFIMAMNTPDNLAGGLARFVALTGGLDGIEQDFETMMSITPEDIREAAKLFSENTRNVIRLTGDK